MEQLNIFNVLHEKFKIDNTNGVSNKENEEGDD
jgi:hypothetical protein